jgi:hypothetical protein
MSHFFFFVPTLAVVMAVTLALAHESWRYRSRRGSEQRAIALLRSWLTPEQLNQWDSRDEFEVIGFATGTRYRITRGVAMNVHQLNDTGEMVRQWCFQPQGKLAVGDVLLAQKIALEKHGAPGACFGEFAALSETVALV